MKKFRITMFGAIALVIVLMILFRSVTGRDNPLFDEGVTTTFYAETAVAEAEKMPETKEGISSDAVISK